MQKLELKSQDGRLAAIFLIMLIDVLGLTIILPLLPFYSERFGASAATVGALIAVYAGCQLVAGPILGYFSDRVGRKPILILSQVGTCISFVMLALAPSLRWIFLARIVDGVTAGNLSTAQAYISDSVQPKDRAKALGRISIAFAIGFFIGPAVTAFLYRLGYRAPIFAAATLSFASILATTFFLPSQSGPEHTTPTGNAATGVTKRRFFKRPELKNLFAEILLFFFSFSAYVAGFALFAERTFRFHGHPFGAKETGFALAWFGLVGIVTQGLLIGKLVARFGERFVVLLGFVTCTLGYGLLALVHMPVWILPVGLFAGFGGSILRPVLLSEIAGRVRPQERGSVLGFTQSLQSASQIAAPLLGTWLIGRSQLNAWVGLCSALSALGAVLVVRRLTGNL